MCGVYAGLEWPRQAVHVNGTLVHRQLLEMVHEYALPLLPRGYKCVGNYHKLIRVAPRDCHSNLAPRDLVGGPLELDTPTIARWYIVLAHKANQIRSKIASVDEKLAPCARWQKQACRPPHCRHAKGRIDHNHLAQCLWSIVHCTAKLSTCFCRSHVLDHSCGIRVVVAANTVVSRLPIGCPSAAHAPTGVRPHRSSTCTISSTW